MKIATVSYNDKTAAKDLTDSLHYTGFAVLSHHPIEPRLIDDVYEEWRQFFKNEQRFNYLFNRETHEGYVPLSLSETAKGYGKKDIKEFYHLYSWGRYPTMLSDKSRILAQQLTELASFLLGWIERYTPVEISKRFSEPLSGMLKGSTRNLFRILRYPPLTGEEQAGALRAAPHEDINLITLLPTATEPGLQAKDNHGVWHNVPCDHGMIIINVGDMLEECSQGWYQSTTHQVMNPSDEHAIQERLSMPLFLHARDDVRLSTRHTANSYLQERYEELGLA